MKTLQEVMEKHRNLGDIGFIIRGRGEAENDYKSRIVEAQLTLFASMDEIAAAVKWIQERLEPAEKIYKDTNSYTLKHYAERECGYVSNGAFVAAMLMCGYECEQYSPNSINGCFNISAKKIKELKKSYYGK